jgi:hypothetical protein
MSYDTDPLGLFGPKTGKTWEWEQVVHGLGVVCIEFQMLETVQQTRPSAILAKLFGRLTPFWSHFRDFQEFPLSVVPLLDCGFPIFIAH